MQRVIVTVKLEGENPVRDLEVPAEVESGRLAEMIAGALRWETDPAGQPIQYEIMAEPPGRVLDAQESLADAGAWDGAWLVFRPLGDAPIAVPEPVPSPPSPPRPRPPVSEAVGGYDPIWEPLGIDLPPDSEPAQDAADSEETGFVWKQLD